MYEWGPQVVQALSVVAFYRFCNVLSPGRTNNINSWITTKSFQTDFDVNENMETSCCPANDGKGWLKYTLGQRK